MVKTLNDLIFLTKSDIWTSVQNQIGHISGVGVVRSWKQNCKHSNTWIQFCFSFSLQKIDQVKLGNSEIGTNVTYCQTG